MHRVAYPIATLLILAASASWSKSQNLRIEIVGDGLSETIVITDPEILGLFNIWNGPGVVARGPDGMPYPPAHLDLNESDGRFVDWPRGMATERPSGLQRLEVTFVVGAPGRPDVEGSYVVAYEVDSRDSSGFVYLPMWTNDLIRHGVEGNWFHATGRWNEAIAPVVASHTGVLRAPSERENLSCVVGHGSLRVDGVVEFTLVDEHGAKTSRWRYGPGSERYDEVRDHIGDVERGEETEISCWPPRS